MVEGLMLLLAGFALALLVAPFLRKGDDRSAVSRTFGGRGRGSGSGGGVFGGSDGGGGGC
ncbi:hypothetical protein AN216_11685 [Streptomyces oceani]|uniref:Uncharacterized protein n=1 Tax=Streptomyces oceani TaxID=1075402 RepID=A0A1E7KHU3_9ACTN|nr:hypothetical protein AN216_11685 [Streptomyces oceani]